ncbi:unnamed protein product [Effrenium voratum]|nr:unnamed protein product [Effrenium voratum]
MTLVPKKLLTQADESAKNLRRQLMRGATVVFVTAGLPGKRFTFEIAVSLGIKPVILEHPDSWSRSLVEQGLAAKFIPVDMTQSSEDVYKEALEAIRHLGEDGITGPADGIATFVELSVPLAARLAETLGLPGLRPAAVDAARNKHTTRACLKEAGLPTPRNFLITDESKLLEAGKTVGFPSVLKPVSGAASLGVKKVTNQDDMARCYKEIVDELSTLVVTSGALVQGSPEQKGQNAKQSGVDLTVLMEQFLDGPEVDVDVIWMQFMTAIFIFLGGLKGFVEAKSKASLIASTVIVIIILALDWVAYKVNFLGGEIPLFLLGIMLTVMFYRKHAAKPAELQEPLSTPKKKGYHFLVLTFLCAVAALESGWCLLHRVE